jgi:hypothetical protein
MDITHRITNTVEKTEQELATAQTAATSEAKTQLEKDAVGALFGAAAKALSGQDPDAQASVTAHVATGEHLTHVYLDITVVPSAGVQTQRLADSEALAASPAAGSVAAQ